MKNILVRADSSSLIGIGHIMRDLVLVQEYVNSNITFACQNLDGNINSKIIESGYDLKILNSNERDELDNLIKILKVDFLIIDHYEIDYNYEEQIKNQNPTLKTLAFDDTYEKHYCDILLNHNIYANEEKYKNLTPTFCKLRCGEKYILLRDEFTFEKGKEKNNSEKYIVLSFGGTDHLNLNMKILDLLQKIDFETKIKVITTSSNVYVGDLYKYSFKNKDVEVIVNTNKIAEIFHNALFAISSASTVVGELIFLDIPFIAIKTADNQNMMYDFLKEKNYNVLEKFNEKELEKYIRSKNAF
jgi:UDP-2,4-diacetamido-2,4,6-trideoxy-beta-L-altropyranose hydrolase